MNQRRSAGKVQAPTLREDRKTYRPLTVAGVLFTVAMLAVLATLAGMAVTGEHSRAQSFFGLGFVASAVSLAAATINMFYRYCKCKWFYRCPECGQRIPRLESALPSIHYYCAACNIEWTTGWYEAE
jgi:hypothetical protein